jgi:hypothetical protein
MDCIQPIILQHGDPRMQINFLIRRLHSRTDHITVQTEQLNQAIAHFESLNDPFLECEFSAVYMP